MVKIINLLLIITVVIVLSAPPHETAPTPQKKKKHESFSDRSKKLHSNIKIPKNVFKRRKITNFRKADGNFAWERSGLYEGDIRMPMLRNAYKNRNLRWPNSTVPYAIDLNDYKPNEIAIIQNAIADFNKHTCMLFRPFNNNDKNFILIEGKHPGCWSSVGVQPGGQIVNIEMNSGCIHHYVIIHEIMHAIGFAHQQSSSDRDNYVTVLWNNINEGQKYNFHNNIPTMDFGVGYDFQSVMHYSETAFSKNGFLTLMPKIPGVQLGQEVGFSLKDIEKINRMYGPIYCHGKFKPRPELGNISPAPSISEVNEIVNGITNWWNQKGFLGLG